MPKYPGISPYDNEKGTLGTAKKRWEKIYVKNIESDTITGMNAEIENLATTAENSVTQAVAAKNAAEQAKTAAQTAAETAATAAAGIQSVVETDVDATLSISGVAADAKVTGDWLNAIAKPVTGSTETPGPCDEFLQYVEDSEHRLLFGIKRDGSVTWQKGIPQHVKAAMTPVMENDEYLYAIVDPDEHVLFAIKKDGTVDWPKGTPKHVVEACNPTMENDEYLYAIVDPDEHVLFAIKKDGTVDWPKGTPKHVVEACNPTMENDEYIYLIKDAEDKVLFGIKKDGTVDWQKGTPKHVVEACNPTIENDEYLYLIKDAEDKVLFGIKQDGSVYWPKGLPKWLAERISQDIIESEEFIQLTQDSEGKLIEGVLKTGEKKFFSDVSFTPETIQKIADSIARITPSLLKYENYIKSSIGFVGGSLRYVGLDVLYLDGDTIGMTKDNKVNLSYHYLDYSGTCTCKWQGNTSVGFPKKNYTIAKLKPAIDVGWGTQNKYVLKADFIDASRARNVVSAKLWGGVVKSRTPVNERLSALPNGGAIDGFPIMLVINGEYQGIYNFNIPKDGWMLGMGESSTEAIFNSEGGNFKSTVTKEEVLNAQKWEIAYLPDEDNPDWAINSLNRMLQATIDSTGTNYRNTLEDYLDIESAIDYFIYCVLLDNADGITKNFLLGTYDGMRWFFVAYDLDWTFGSHFWGTSYLSPRTVNSFATVQGRNRAFHLIYMYDKEALKARYNELRNGALSENNVLTTFSEYLAKIPKSLIDEDYKLWPTTPGTLVNNFSQIMNWYRIRVKYMDEEIANL